MKKFYSDPTQMQKWGRDVVGQGLYPTEKALIEKHLLKGGTLLNIGCGGGREAIALCSEFDIVAVDYNREFCRMCKSAQDHDHQFPVMAMEAGNLAFGDGAFDNVIMVGQLLGHIRGRENRIAALKEINRVLQPDGVALVSTNSIELGLKYRAYFAVINSIRRLYNPGGLEPDDAYVFRGSRGKQVFHWYRTAEFLSDAKAAGLKVVEYLRRFEFENEKTISDPSTSGETFYVLKK